LINQDETSGPELGRKLTILGSLLWLVIASPTLVESGAYRCATAILLMIGLYFYRRMRPAAGWIGWLCIGWSFYVLSRFAYIYAVTPGHDIGAMDWLYAFPMFFPLLGFTYSLYERHGERIVAAFFALALIMLAATTHYSQIFAGETVRPLIMNNQIHGAVACGMIICWASFWLLHYLTAPDSNRLFARFSLIVGPPVILLCLVAIYGAKSKGVWLALGLTLPVIALAVLSYLKRSTGVIIVLCAAAVLSVGLYTVRQNLYATAGPTAAAALSMADAVVNGHGLDNTVAGTISSDTTPISMDERLQLWSNAWEVFSSAPVFGWGNAWLERYYQTRRYADVPYTLLHNGYLEILVRFGLFGAVVMSVMLGSFIVCVWRARRAGIIPPAACHAYLVCLFFFALTILSNSNNRLAIGESLALGSSAFAYACSMRLRKRTNVVSSRPEKQPVIAVTAVKAEV
jgi:O-antigen ligase